MKYFTYSRVSTSNQDNANQQNAVQRYLKANDITVSEQVEDSCSGTVPYMQRNLGRLVSMASRGDVIISSEQSRFSRVEREFTRLTWECQDRGITLYCIKEDLAIGESNDLGVKLRAFLSSNESESERSKVSWRTSNSLQQRKDIIEKDGYFITNSGVKCTKLGNPSVNSAEAGELSPADKGRLENKKRWADKLRSDSSARQAYAMIKLLKGKGDTNVAVVAYLTLNGFKSQSGKDFLPSSLSAYCKRCVAVGF